MKHVKKGVFVLLIGALVPFVAMAAGQAEAGAVEEVTISLSTHHPADVARSLPARLIKEEIEKATDGRVTIDIYYAESLARGGEVLESVQEGIVDIGDLNPAYYPGQLPLHSGVLVFTKAPPTHEQKREVMERAYEAYPEFANEIEQYNQRVLWQYQPTPLALSSTVPVRSIDDFRGLTIRASSEAYLRMLGDLGAIPISVPFTDSYMALETGTIQGVYTNIDAMSGQRFYEPAPYTFTSAELSLFLPFTFTINTSVWNSFTAETQEQIMTAMDVVHERYGQAYDEEYQRQIDIFRERGEEVVFASQEDIETWQNLPIIEVLKEELAEKAGEAGIADGQKFVDDFERFMVEAAQ
jgi:TRAP-type C4-dicarboxylate transport system substrate-binding protein